MPPLHSLGVAPAGRLEQIATKADRILGQLDSGLGTGGALRKDPALYDELKTLATDLRKHPWKILWKD
ncbi:hypothetical protein [Corallococcus exiguus]|uniref:hypothetical protein n=1 Tax=Corallococcus exiguus TaxID=83462 RepID=UPI001C277F17|nr:hypothetical protein [Corallococcus exiguus]NRD53251.1 hypothetical protein [Corallococcus exiguus]